MAAESLDALMGDLPEPDRAAAEAVRRRAGQVLRPVGALSRLDEVAAWMAGWQRTAAPRVRAPAAIVFAADHGVVEEGVSAYPSEVTRAMVKALENGVATANVIARSVGARLSVLDCGVGLPSANIAREPALDHQRFAESVGVGRRAVAASAADLLIFGEVGIGNTTAASAVCAGLFGGGAGRWTGRGAGLDDAGYARKVEVVDRAVARLGPETQPLEVLRELGGAELVAIAAAVVEARLRSIPVILDGFVVAAAVAPLWLARRDALSHCLAGHRSGEPGHGRLLLRLGMEPLLDLSMRLGEGTGGLASIPLVRLACDAVADVATFEEWGLRRP